MRFSLMLGLSPVIAVKFNYQGWIFLEPSVLEDTGKYWAVSLENAQKNGNKFGQFFEN